MPFQRFFKDLEILNLAENKIVNEIKPIIEAGFKKLKKLDLSSNEIENINYLGDPSLSNLESLYLNNNKISDISILSQTNFKNLKDLQLCGNHFENIDVFGTKKLNQ